MSHQHLHQHATHWPTSCRSRPISGTHAELPCWQVLLSEPLGMGPFNGSYLSRPRGVADKGNFPQQVRQGFGAQKCARVCINRGPPTGTRCHWQRWLLQNRQPPHCRTSGGVAAYGPSQSTCHAEPTPQVCGAGIPSCVCPLVPRFWGCRILTARRANDRPLHVIPPWQIPLVTAHMAPTAP
jgi:hypothetical protein